MKIPYFKISFIRISCLFSKNFIAKTLVTETVLDTEG